ncbi:MAG: hypothetical protein EOP84_07550 [Verrucomicrobiaceae bacterium]|nr:MAG: hypothetical protein EOP84_07550 [Verrucomicrobiaceae bacterium]
MLIKQTVNTITPRKAVAVALKAMKAKVPDALIAKELISAGASPAEAPTIVSSIREGFKAGVQSRVMGTRAHPVADQFYLSAFAEGRFAMRFTSPAWVLLRAISPYLIGGAILAFLLWKFVF